LNEAGTGIKAGCGRVPAGDSKEYLPRVTLSRPGDDLVEQQPSSTETSKLRCDPHLIDVSDVGLLCLDSAPYQANPFATDLGDQRKAAMIVVGGG
jgi:hypothetical protein